MATRDQISQPRTTEHPQYAAMTPTVQRRVSRQANDIAQWLVILRYPYSASYKVQVHQPETPAHQGGSRHRGQCRHGPPNTCNAFGRYLGHRRQCPGALTILVGDNIGEQHHRARGGRGEQQLQHRVFGIGHDGCVSQWIRSKRLRRTTMPCVKFGMSLFSIRSNASAGVSRKTGPDDVFS